jgi:hypothetical protein
MHDQIRKVDFIFDTDTHEDKKAVDVLVVFLQQDLVLSLKPGLCISPLRG